MGASECAGAVAAGERITHSNAHAKPHAYSDPDAHPNSDCHSNPDSDAHSVRWWWKLCCAVELDHCLYGRNGGQRGQQQLHCGLLDRESEPDCFRE